MRKNNIQIFTLVIIGVLMFNLAWAQEKPRIEFVSIPAGTFMMGDHEGIGQEDERPVRNIAIKGFQVSKTEITVAQFRQFCKETNRKFPQQPTTAGNENLPVVNVSWNEAIAYTKWLSDRLKLFVRLPRETEWEYIARKGMPTEFIDSQYHLFENYRRTDRPHIMAVASKRPDKFGVYDINGNVSEWCLDDYAKHPNDSRLASLREVRGGSWKDDMKSLRVSARKKMSPVERSEFVGFRVVIAKSEIRGDPETLLCSGIADLRIEGFDCPRATSFVEELLRYGGYNCKDIPNDFVLNNTLEAIWLEHYSQIQCPFDSAAPLLAYPESGLLGRAVYGTLDMFWALYMKGFQPDLNVVDKNGDTIVDWIDKQIAISGAPPFIEYLKKTQAFFIAFGAKRAKDL